MPVNAPTFQLRYGMTAMIIRGDPTPAMTAVLTPPATSPVVGSIFEVKMSVYTPAYVASGVQIQPKAPLPSGLTLRSVQTKRFDGASMAFSINDDTLTLGNALPDYPRQASYFFTADTPGPKTFFVRAWSENGGEVVANTTFEVQALSADLVPTAMGTSPAAPVSAPGSSFSVTDTVQNVGPGPSVASKTRYYLSLDAVKSADDTLLTGTHSVPGLEAGASHTATVTVTIPAGTAAERLLPARVRGRPEHRGRGERDQQLHRDAGRYRDRGPAGSGGDRGDHDSGGAGAYPRGDLLRDGHRAQRGRGGGRRVDDALLPVARRGEERG